MGKFMEKQHAKHEALMAQLVGMLQPGEQLVGSVTASEKAILSSRVYVVGITNARLIFVPVNIRSMVPLDKPAISVTPSEITSTSIWGHGGGLKTALSASAGREIRFTTPTKKWKLMTLGGNWFENLLADDRQIGGLDALIGFLQAAEPR